MINYIWKDITGAVCSSLNGLASQYCLPIKVSCRETDKDGFLFLCDKKPCDVNCNWEQVSIIPFVRGDKIMFQTQFRDVVNNDPTAPVLGWGAWMTFTIYNAETGIAVTSSLGHSMISRYYVCHNGENSYQVMEIDTGGIAVPCSWYIQFSAWDGVTEEAVVIDERCSHVFSAVNECQETLLIEGVYERFDCLGNYYGEPSCEDGVQPGATMFAYRNTTRIEARVSKLAPEVDGEDRDITVVENYELSTKYAKTPGQVFLHNYLLSWYSNLMTAPVVEINGEIIKNISNFALNYDQQNPNSAVVEWSWKEKCNDCQNG